MNYTFSKIGFPLLLAAVLFGCKKNSDGGGGDASFQSFALKFGPDSTAVSIDNAVQEIKNMPRGYDVTKLAAAAVLPAGYSISPDPATVTDYTKGVTYTIKTDNGKTYTVQITVPVYNPINNPYGIYTVKQLSEVRNGLNDSYVLMTDIQLPDVTASNAGANTGISDYGDYGWYSIGSKFVDGGQVIFRGSLDGQNHVIKNFTIAGYRSNSLPNGDVVHKGKSCDGLFGNAVHATFKNIGIQLAAAGINDVATDGSANAPVGSLVGQADSCTITNCYVTGSGAIRAGQYTGGLIGKSLNTTISKCYAALTSTAGNYAIISTSTGGGLIGSAFNCNVTDSYASCSVFSASDVGGLIGAMNTGTLKTSYATGSVTEVPFNTSGSLIASNSLGGLVGMVTSASPLTSAIQNCYATGAVTGANGSNSDFHKGTRIGGLVGLIAPNSGPVSVTFCYASGQVSRAWTSASAPFLTGALAGNTPNGVFITGGTCTNYWDRTTTGQTVLGGANGILAQDNAFTTNGKTTAEMKTPATYTSWDFSAVWNVAASTNNGYPSLRSTIK